MAAEKYTQTWSELRSAAVCIPSPLYSWLLPFHLTDRPRPANANDDALIKTWRPVGERNLFCIFNHFMHLRMEFRSDEDLSKVLGTLMGLWSMNANRVYENGSEH